MILCIRLASDILGTVLLGYGLGKWWRKALSAQQSGWVLQLILTAAMYLLIEVLTQYPSSIYQRREDIPITMLILAFLEYTLLVCSRTVYMGIDKQDRLVKEQALQDQLGFATRQYTLIRESLVETRRIRHDLKYHLQLIHGYLQQGDYDQATRYVEDFAGELAKLSDVTEYTKNTTVNILAGYYMHKAKTLGIQTTTEIRLPETLSAEAVHLTTLLGNMWRNAIEACIELPTEQNPFLDTLICFEYGKLIIRCRNSTKPVKRDSLGNLLSTKGQGHGHGMESMRLVVEAYGGYYTAKEQDGVFTFGAVLELPTTPV